MSYVTSALEIRKPIKQYENVDYAQSHNSVYKMTRTQHNVIGSDLEPTVEPTEYFYYQTNSPSYNITHDEYPLCICKTTKNENDSKIIILIIVTSLTSFFSILLVCFIIWYRFFFKRSLMNKNENKKRLQEDFGIVFTDAT